MFLETGPARVEEKRQGSLLWLLRANVEQWLLSEDSQPGVCNLGCSVPAAGLGVGLELFSLPQRERENLKCV